MTMKPSTPHADTPPTCDRSRRSILGFAAAAAAGVALLPRIGRSAAEVADQGPLVQIARVDANGDLIHLRRATGGEGLFRVRVRDVGVNAPFAIEARYGEDFHHRFWQAWKQHDGSMTHSHGAAVACHAQSTGIELVIRVGGKPTSCALPAEPGLYALTVAAPAGATTYLQGRFTAAGSSRVFLSVEPLAA